MFSKTAAWYDALYSSKDYQKESDLVIRLIQEKHPSAKTVLDVACGTAEHDKYLSRVYQVDGMDINPEFIDIAREKNPAGRYHCADMIDFDLHKTYDVVLSLFSAIGYVKTLDNMIRTLRSFKRHLNPGGIIIVEPWLTPEAWNPEGNPFMVTAETDTAKICRMNSSERVENLSIFNFHYLIGTTTGVEHITERHELGLFTVEQMQDAFSQAGLAVSYDSEGLTGRGVYVGSLPV